MFSAYEQQLLLTDDFFKHKRNITDKIYIELAIVRERSQLLLTQHLPSIPSEVILSGKISRGENLEGLPWINMDCPGWFKHDHVFSIRYLFWWSRFFSVTLHVAGDYLHLLKNDAVERSSEFANTFICVNNTPWKYHYGTENYLPAKLVTEAHSINQMQRPFIKISICYTLEDMNALTQTCNDGLIKILTLLKG